MSFGMRAFGVGAFATGRLMLPTITGASNATFTINALARGTSAITGQSAATFTVPSTGTGQPRITGVSRAVFAIPASGAVAPPAFAVRVLNQSARVLVVQDATATSVLATDVRLGGVAVVVYDATITPGAH